MLVVDELWQWADSRAIPRQLRLCTQAGRERGVQLFTATQEPHRVNSSIVGQAPELVCFRLQEPKAWACIKDLGADADQVDWRFEDGEIRGRKLLPKAGPARFRTKEQVLQAIEASPLRFIVNWDKLREETR